MRKKKWRDELPPRGWAFSLPADGAGVLSQGHYRPHQGGNGVSPCSPWDAVSVWLHRGPTTAPSTTGARRRAAPGCQANPHRSITTAPSPPLHPRRILPTAPSPPLHHHRSIPTAPSPPNPPHRSIPTTPSPPLHPHRSITTAPSPVIPPTAPSPVPSTPDEGDGVFVFTIALVYFGCCRCPWLTVGRFILVSLSSGLCRHTPLYCVSVCLSCAALSCSASPAASTCLQP